MTDSIEEAIRQATLALEEATSRILTMAHEIARLRDDRAELRRALYECSYCLNSLNVAPSAMTKTTMDTLVRMNLGGFND
jgi:chromosome segregation ATPase